MKIQLEMFGETLVNRELLRVADRAIDARPAFMAILGKIEDITAENFEGEGKFVGGWTPLKPATVARKERLGLRPEIEQATGHLLDTLTLGALGGDTRKAMPDGLEYGTDVPYARAQHKGNPDTSLPARPLVAFQENHKRGFVKTLQTFVMTGQVVTI